MIILGIVLIVKYDCDAGIAITTIFSFLEAICLVFIIFAINNTAKIPQMDERISIYQEENTRIEEQIKTTIQVYQDYEKEIFSDINLDDISSEKLIMLTSLYPNLKSDTMVQELIKTYNKNTEELKQLKTQKLDYELYRWWLCFV